MASVYTDNDGVRIHAVDNQRVGALVPALVVPGMGETAGEFTWMLDELGDRRVVVVDVRGRGESDTPARGYTWADHYGDVLAVMAAHSVERPVVIGFSRGSSYAIGAALHAPEPVRGLVVNDYMARHMGMEPEMVDVLANLRNRGRTMEERMSRDVIEKIVADSEEIPLWDRLAELECPLLVVRGGRPGVVVTADVAKRYRAARPDVEIVVIRDQGHDLWSRDIPTYLATLAPFLARIDASAAS